jgi:hypothetical protein
LVAGRLGTGRVQSTLASVQAVSKRYFSTAKAAT